ncbi:MAG: hypothetical protein ACOVOV_18115, partial [Dolichospermum sp.]
MSTLSVSNITTANGSEPLTIATGNTQAGDIVLPATGGVVVGPNSTVNSVILGVGTGANVLVTNSTGTYLGSGNTSGTKIVITPNGDMTFYTNSSANAAYIMTSMNSFHVTTKLEVGSHTLGGYDFGSLAAIEVDLNQNTYLQVVVQNANTGNNASSDLVLTNDQGNDTVNFIDLGINGSGYNQAAFNIGGAGDGYLYTS